MSSCQNSFQAEFDNITIQTEGTLCHQKGTTDDLGRGAPRTRIVTECQTSATAGSCPTLTMWMPIPKVSRWVLSSKVRFLT